MARRLTFGTGVRSKEREVNTARFGLSFVSSASSGADLGFPTKV